MKFLHFLQKFLLRIRTEGIKATIRELVFIKRTIIVIEKDVTSFSGGVKGDMISIIVDKDNYKKFNKINSIKNIERHIKRGAQALIVLRGGDCLGWQIWTNDGNFIDLKKIGIHMGKDDVYLFDLFVFPKYRGSNITKIICAETYNYLACQGIKKTYGFFYLDNIPSLWWHRAYLKCKEIKRIKVSRFFFVEFARGRLFFNI